MPFQFKVQMNKHWGEGVKLFKHLFGCWKWRFFRGFLCMSNHNTCFGWETRIKSYLKALFMPWGNLLCRFSLLDYASWSQSQKIPPGHKPRKYLLVINPESSTWSQTQKILPGRKARKYYLVTNPESSTWSQSQKILPGLKARTYYLVTNPENTTWSQTQKVLPGPKTQKIVAGPKPRKC